MKKRIYFLGLFLVSIIIFSCASSKGTNNHAVSKEERKAEKENKKLARQKERNAPPTQESNKPVLKPTTTPQNTVPRKLVNE